MKLQKLVKSQKENDAMSRKARMWIGATLLIVVVFNYIIVGMPLFKRSSSLEDKYKAMLIKQVKSGEILKGSGNEYILEIFKREKSAIDRRILILNCVAASLSIFVASWVIFGLVAHKR